MKLLPYIDDHKPHKVTSHVVVSFSCIVLGRYCVITSRGDFPNLSSLRMRVNQLKF